MKNIILLFSLCAFAQVQQVDYVRQVKNKPAIDPREYGFSTAASGADNVTALTSALAACSTGCTILIPPGTFNMAGLVNLSGKTGLVLKGSGIGSTTLNITHATNNLFYWTTAVVDLTLGDFSVTSSSVTRTAGWVAAGVCAYTSSCYLARSRIEKVDIKDQFGGLHITQFEQVAIDSVFISAFSGLGIGIKAGQTAATAVNQGAGLHITNTKIYGMDFVSRAVEPPNYGLWIEDCDAVFVRGMEIGASKISNVVITATGYRASDHFFEQLVSDATISGPGVHITGTGLVTETQFDNCWFSGAGRLTPFSDSAGIHVTNTGTVGRIDIRNSRFFANRGPAIDVDRSGGLAPMMITGNRFTSNGAAGTVGNRDTIQIDVALDNPAPFLASNIDDGNGGGGVSISTSATSNLVSLSANYMTSGATFGIAPRLNNANYNTGDQQIVPPVAFADLGTATAGKVVYCANCTTGATCSSGGTGRLAVGNGSTWMCQ